MLEIAKRVLVIVKDREFVSTISRALVREGRSVVEASDGNEGIAIARSICPDLVILSLILPKRSGFLVLERLRKTHIHCPALIVTNLEGLVHHEYDELLGRNDRFLQSATMSSMMDCVANLLR